MSSFAELGAKKEPFWLAAAIKDSNLAIIVAFCAIGLLITLNVMLRIPDLGAIISQLS